MADEEETKYDPNADLAVSVIIEEYDEEDDSSSESFQVTVLYREDKIA